MFHLNHQFFTGLFIIFVVLIPLSIQAQKKNLELTVVVQSKSSSAPLMIAVNKRCNPFPNDSVSVKLIKAKPENNKALVVIDDLNYGEYAIAIFQDMNGDSLLNSGMFRIPKEPYGFSNNFRPKISAPTFDGCKFNYSEINFKVEVIVK